MNEKALLLISNIEEDLQVIAEIYAALDRYELPGGHVTSEDGNYSGKARHCGKGPVR